MFRHGLCCLLSCCSQYLTEKAALTAAWILGVLVSLLNGRELSWLPCSAPGLLRTGLGDSQGSLGQ